MALADPMDARQILWTDNGAYRLRYEKTATALVAVQRALESRRPLLGEEDEFLQLYTVIASAAPELFTKIWEDPFSYFWARRAYELVGLCLKPTDVPFELRRYCLAIGANDPREALNLHLQEFKRFVVALEMMTGGTRRFREPLETTLPVSIPGTPYSVLGSGRIQVIGVTGTTLDVAGSGRNSRLTPGAGGA